MVRVASGDLVYNVPARILVDDGKLKTVKIPEADVGWKVEENSLLGGDFVQSFVNEWKSGRGVAALVGK
jgi:hypothetical protein